MNIHFIEGFLETVHQKSIAKASEKLRVSHPALSKQIRALEAYYGVTLFKRSSAGVELTEAGSVLYNRIVPVLAEMTTIKAELANLNDSPKIALGTLPSLAAHYLPEIVYRLENNKAEVHVTVRNTSSELYELLRTGTINAAVLERQVSHAASWRVDLFEESYYAVVYSRHHLAGLPSITIQQIAQEPLILNPPDCSIRKLFASLMAEQGMAPQIKTEVHFGEFILGYVAAGAGITIVPKILADNLGNPDLIAIPIEDVRAKRTISLISQSKRIGQYLTPYFKGSYPG